MHKTAFVALARLQYVGRMLGRNLQETTSSPNFGILLSQPLDILRAQIMAAITIQPENFSNYEDPASSPVIGSESRPSLESATDEKSGDEEALLQQNPSGQKDGQHSSSSASRTKLILWMLANTLATVGIVRT